MNLKPITIVFTKSKKIFPIGSWSIRAFSSVIKKRKIGYSHVARRVQVRDWGITYYQASEGNVNYEYHTVFDTKHEIVKEYTIWVPEDLEESIRKACFQEAGKKYASMQNLGIFLVWFIGLFGIKMKNPWKKGRNCSELLYVHVLKQLYPDLEYDPETIRPDDIEDIILRKFCNPSEIR